MFCDLNITRCEESNIPELLETLIKYGYETIAFTTNIDDESLAGNENGKKKKKPNNLEAIPKPLDLSKYSTYKIKLYNRINAVVSNPISFHHWQNNATFRLYDIISYQPANGEVLKTLSNMANFDILSYNPTAENSDLLMNRKMYSKFVSNNVFMELCYGLALTDSIIRRNIIQKANVYQCVGAAKNIIVSCGNHNLTRLRAPHDVVYLSYIFGFSEGQAKMAITKSCEKVLLHARTRRRGKCAFEIILQPLLVNDTERKSQVNDLPAKKRRLET